jgi:hypothetical protein
MQRNRIVHSGARRGAASKWLSAPIAYVIAATLALLAGVLIYVTARPAGSVYLLPASVMMPQQGSPFGIAAVFLPSFLHVLAFTLLTAAILRPRTHGGIAAIAGVWCAINVLFVICQHTLIAPRIAASLPDWFARVALLENVGPYFLRGTFDYADIAAAVAGAGVAWLLVRLQSSLSLSP